MMKRVTPALRIARTMTALLMPRSLAQGIAPADRRREHLVMIGVSFLSKTIVGRR